MISGEPRGLCRIMNASRVLLSLSLWRSILSLPVRVFSKEKRVFGLGFGKDASVSWRKCGRGVPPFCLTGPKFPTEFIGKGV